MCSRCLGHQPYDVQVEKSPSFLAAFLRGTPSFWSRPLGILRVYRAQWWRSQPKRLRPWRDLFSLYLYHVGPFNVDLKCSYTPDYIATLFLWPMYALHGLAVRAIQCKVAMSCFRDRTWRHKWNSEGWCPKASGTHHNTPRSFCGIFTHPTPILVFVRIDQVPLLLPPQPSPPHPFPLF